MSNPKRIPDRPDPARGASGGRRLLVGVFMGAVVGTLLVTWVLVEMFGRKQEERERFVRVAEVTEISTDPEPWGRNWPQQFDGWKSTAGDKFYGGSNAMPKSKLEQQPWLRRLYAGYAFSIDYREARGHAYMLYDQGVTERVTKKPQAGACIHCHASNTVMYRKAGLEAMGRPADPEALASDFDMPAVIRGFREVSRRPYQEVLELTMAAPDGTPGENTPIMPQAPMGGFSGEIAGETVGADSVAVGEAHPVSCIDCHSPETMGLRVTRPGFVLGMRALADGSAPVPHLPSVERWRRGDRDEPYDPNTEASRAEMRSFVCGQCHVEYYCASNDVLEFPWSKGLTMEQAEAHWESKTFPDGSEFYDWEHGETGAQLFKVQHPEFELWSQGIHAQSGVSCADCHMPYQRIGASKVSQHGVTSPLGSVAASCQTCHSVPESELRAKVDRIQDRTTAMTERAAEAMTAMLDAILAAQVSDVSPQELAPVLSLQRQAMWRLDYISSENSEGFHADQEAMRILAESIDFSRRAQALALELRAPPAPSVDGVPTEGVLGVTDDERAEGGED